MSLDKAIEHGKEHRKPYYDCRAIDATCRCHGSCDWCRRNRVHKNERRAPADDPDYEEYEHLRDDPMYDPDTSWPWDLYLEWWYPD